MQTPVMPCTSVSPSSKYFYVRRITKIKWNYSEVVCYVSFTVPESIIMHSVDVKFTGIRDGWSER